MMVIVLKEPPGTFRQIVPDTFSRWHQAPFNYINKATYARRLCIKIYSLNIGGLPKQWDIEAQEPSSAEVKSYYTRFMSEGLTNETLL